MRAFSPGAPRRAPGEVEQWITAAHCGDAEALGRLLESLRPYLLLLANHELPADLRAKVGASDLVQDTCLEAQRDFAQFRGRTEEELRGWLRQGLLHNLANQARFYRETDKRAVSREVRLSEAAPCDLYPALLYEETPSGQAMAHEQDEALRQAVEELPENYRQVIRWRNYERLSFEEIAQRLDRTAGAARKLWLRAVERLQATLEPPHETG
jgi:RNA polymerase sigma-70 factor, ECF subfamily